MAVFGMPVEIALVIMFICAVYFYACLASSKANEGYPGYKEWYEELQKRDKK